MKEAELSMIASSLKETYPLPKKTGTLISKDYKVLPVAAIYGANASGKSNLLHGMKSMKWFVLNSFSRKSTGEPIPIVPFRFSQNTITEPSEFEVSFTFFGSIYRYGFETSPDKIVSEWLFRKELKPRAKEKELFYRESGQLQFHPQLFKVGKLINDQQLLKEDVLAITLAFQLNEEQVKPVIRWFRNVLTIQGHDDGDYQEYSKNLLRHDSSYASSMTDLVRFADTSIENITTTQIDGKTEVVTSHVYYNAEGKPDGKIEMLLNENESDGTQKLFNLSGYLFDALDVGCLLIIDEMDAKLHPNLMEKIITMFQDPAINNKRAQLIFTTHNTNILDAKLLRRDQLWITEKDRIGASSLYSIADYNTGKGKARNTEALEQNYIQGKYGGVPFLGELENFLDKQRHEQTSPAKH